MAVFFLASLCFQGALKVSIPQDVYEFARGDNITLPCKFEPKKPQNPLVIVTWTVDGGKATDPEKLVLTYYTAGNIMDIPPLYEGRATLDKDILKGKANLKLSGITLRDNRVFECRIQIPGDDEGTLADTARLVVLVAPSVPVCALQGKPEYGQNINLTCLSEEGSPPPAYTWDQRDVRNTPRIPDARTTDKGGILSLYNISVETSGYYTCTSRNKIRFATCNFTLAVIPPSMNMGATAGLIGGGVAILLILGIVIYCCCCRKKKEKVEEYAMNNGGEGEFHEKEPMAKDPAEDRSEAGTARGRDYDDRRSDYDDRRSDYDDRRSDYDDRRSDYDDRRSDRHDRYEDRADRRREDDRADRRREDDRADRRRDDYHNEDDRADRRRDDYYNEDDRADRRPDDDRYDDRYDEPYDDRESARPKPPSVPSNKPSRANRDD
ncbi:unnamed protein product [Merluccius merluccius]